MIKLLIADPDITFAIGIKRALEQTGEFRVTAFGTAGATLDYLGGEPQDAILIDFGVSDMALSAFITAIRERQPQLRILVSPRNGGLAQSLDALNIQGSLSKPYYARQLAPLVKAAIQWQAPAQPTIQPPSKPVPAFAPMLSPDFDAAIAALPSLIDEPPIAPDDTFRRQLAAMLPEKPATPAGLRKTLDSVDLTGGSLSDEATVSDVVNGKPLSDPPVRPPPPTTHPMPSISEAALDALDTMSMQGFTLDKFADQVEQTSGMTLPDWVREGDSDPLAETARPIIPAQLAATLTQLSVGSAARATLLTFEGQLIAAAGELGDDAAEQAAILIEQTWRAGEDSGSTLIRYLTVPGVGEVLLYSMNTVDGMRLSLLVSNETPMKVIRKQAGQVLDRLSKPDGIFRLELPGEQPSPEDTLLSRPTALRAPEGLRETLAMLEPPPAPVPEAPPIPMTPFSVLLAPSAGTFSADVQPMIALWLTEAGLEGGYQIESAQTQASFITFQLNIPTAETPNAAVKRLRVSTAERAADPGLWTESYYLTSPARPLTQQEIASFLSYVRPSLTVG